MTTYKDTTDYIKSISRDYSIYVCQSRGIPSICDGLKDAQRKALFIIKPKHDKIKTISLAGEMISSNLYLHGDASAAETLSLMGATYCNNVPLLHGIGAFGTKVGPTDWGAARYTYLKKYAITDALIYPDFDILPMKENYDGSVMEPTNFLPLIPIVLLNGISGIAVGWSTQILPRNIDDIINATLAAIDIKNVPTLIPTFDYLDCKTKNIGVNKWEFTGNVRIDGNTVWVEELPPGLNLEEFKARLNQMEEDEKIQTYIDRSTKEIKIEVKFKRGTINNWTEETAINFLKLRSKTTERIVVLDWDNNSIRQYESAEDVVREFVTWRLGFYKKRYQLMVDDILEQINYNLALKACFDGKLPNFLSKALNRQEIVIEIQRICKKLTITDDQIARISSLASYKWAKDSYQEILVNITNLTKTLADYQIILNDPQKLRDIYKKEVLALKKLPKIVR
jgi:DNA gyrase/topoisomerase IV subunit A